MPTGDGCKQLFTLPLKAINFHEDFLLMELPEGKSFLVKFITARRSMKGFAST